RFKEQYHPMLSDSPRRAANMINREYIKQEEDFPIVQCVQLANEFLSHNHTADNWFLQVEMFDPHEPFTAPDRFRNSRSGYDGPVLDWPLYDQLNLADAEAMELRQNYEAVVQMCDHYLGKLLDTFDQYNLWKDTAIILTTDHGFLLGEHDWWGKNRMPVHDPIAHIPLLAYHPDSRPTTTPPAGAQAPDVQAQDQSPPHTEKRCTMLTQCLDLTATILDLYGLDYTPPVTGTATATDADTNAATNADTEADPNADTEADPDAGNSTNTNAE
ncbi:MAG: sulfatase-like hydrolase/transferase, partial [Granulosicoccus sp.]